MQKQRFLCRAGAIFLLALTLTLPARAAELIPMGQAVGIEAKTDGLLVTGFADIETPDGAVSPARTHSF